jgi:hypothetical protein
MNLIRVCWHFFLSRNYQLAGKKRVVVGAVDQGKCMRRVCFSCLF